MGRNKYIISSRGFIFIFNKKPQNSNWIGITVRKSVFLIDDWSGRMLKKWIKLLCSCILLFFIFPAFSENLPEYQGVKPPVNGNSEETEAQLQDDTGPVCYKNCDREVNAQRDRSPHTMSPQEVHNLVRNVLKKTTTPTQPTDGDGSR